MPKRRKVIQKEVKKSFAKLIHILGWLTGIIVALAVGFGMAEETLVIPWLTSIGLGVLVVLAGWIVVILTIVGAVMAIIDAFR